MTLGVDGPPSAVPAPPRLAPARPGGRSREGLAAALVLIAIVVVVFGGYVVADALSQPVGPAVGFRGVVSVRPLAGWADAGRDAVAGAPFVRLTRGSGNLSIVEAVPYTGDARSLASRYVDAVLSPQLDQLSISRVLGDVRLASGLVGVRFGYVGVVAATGSSIEGEVTAVVTPSEHGVVFDGSAPAGLLPFVRSDIQTMIAHAEVR